MEFTFERTDTPALERYEIALLLDRKKMKEHILIGTRSEIRRRLNGDKDAELFHDEERPLGTLLTEFEQDKEKAWNQYGTMPLWNALHTNRFEQPALEKTAREFLEARYKFGTPLEKYAAIRKDVFYAGCARKTALLKQENFTAGPIPQTNCTGSFLQTWIIMRQPAAA